MRKETSHISIEEKLRGFLELISINNEVVVNDHVDDHTEYIHFHRYGKDDYSIGLENGDWSSRGNKEDIINKYLEWKTLALISEEFSSNPNIEFIV